MRIFQNIVCPIVAGFLFLKLYEEDYELCVKGIIAFAIGSFILGFVKRR